MPDQVEENDIVILALVHLWKAPKTERNLTAWAGKDGAAKIVELVDAIEAGIAVWELSNPRTMIGDILIRQELPTIEAAYQEIGKPVAKWVAEAKEDIRVTNAFGNSSGYVEFAINLGLDPKKAYPDLFKDPPATDIGEVEVTMEDIEELRSL